MEPRPLTDERFDSDYYERFYFAPATRVAEPDYFERLAGFVAAYLDVLGVRPETVLDAGCGAGLMHAGLRRAFPNVHIDAFDASRYACERYGWRHLRLEEFVATESYDLVICHDVIQYLDRRAAARALEQLADASHAAFFFGVLTREDWEENCDQDLTDGDVYVRSARWYQKQLRPVFRNAGGGLYIRRDADVVLYALESLG